jgi:hypothetical protein
VQPQLATHSQAILLAKMGKSKGKVIPYLILRGLQKVATYQQVQQQLEQEQITEEQLNQAISIFTTTVINQICRVFRINGKFFDFS